MLDEDDMNCVRCRAEDPPIFLCEAGWWCESCYRIAADIPNDFPSDDLHNGINDGRQDQNIALLKSRVFSDENLDSLLLDGVE